jgi:hypothetical protein
VRGCHSIIYKKTQTENIKEEERARRSKVRRGGDVDARIKDFIRAYFLPLLRITLSSPMKVRRAEKDAKVNSQKKHTL